jgi:hypothetical protein
VCSRIVFVGLSILLVTRCCAQSSRVPGKRTLVCVFASCRMQPRRCPRALSVVFVVAKRELNSSEHSSDLHASEVRIASSTCSPKSIPTMSSSDIRILITHSCPASRSEYVDPGIFILPLSTSGRDFLIRVGGTGEASVELERLCFGGYALTEGRLANPETGIPPRVRHALARGHRAVQVDGTVRCRRGNDDRRSRWDDGTCYRRR